MQKSPRAGPVRGRPARGLRTLHRVEVAPGISDKEPPHEPVPGPDPDREVHFAHTGAAMKTRRSSAGLVLGWGIAGGLYAAVVFLQMVAQVLGLPRSAINTVWAVGLAAMVALGLWMFVRWVRTTRALPPSFVSSNERFRVRCIAGEERLDALRRIGPVQDAAFEPQEFSAYLVLPLSRGMVAAWIATSIVVAAVALLAKGVGLAAPVPVFVFYGAFAAGGMLTVLLWPTRVRVVPGRVEVERALVFRPERPERRVYTLRTSRLLVDLRKWRVHVTGPSPETSLELWLWPVRGRLELAHALLMGAVSTASPPPPPLPPPS